MVLLILVVSLPIATFVARRWWRVQCDVAELFGSAEPRRSTALAPQRTRVRSAPPRRSAEPVSVRITAVLVVDRSLILSVSPQGTGGAGAPDGADQVLVGEMFEADGGATQAVLTRWCETGTPVVMQMGSSRLTFQAHRGSSVVLAAAC